MLLQHPLGVSYRDGKIYVADTYNNKIKVVSVPTGETRTLAGTGVPGRDDDKGTFDEPSGLTLAGDRVLVADTNNHLIRTVDIRSGRVGTLKIDGLQPPGTDGLATTQPDFSRATKVAVRESRAKPSQGMIQFEVEISLPVGWKMNPAAPMKYFLESDVDQGPVSGSAMGWKEVAPPRSRFTVQLPVAGEGSQRLQLGLDYFYCATDGTGLCKIGSVQFSVPLEISASGNEGPVLLKHEARP